jgi:AbrB family looped-hinge helix DNA binding protein
MPDDISMDRAGRIVLPSDVRRRLNLVPGARVAIAIVAGRIELTPLASAEAPVVLSRTSRKVLGGEGPATDAAALVRAERDSQAAPRSRR